MGTKTISKCNKNIIIATVLVVFLLLVYWLNTTALPAVMNVPIVGVTIAIMALLFLCIGYYQSVKQRALYRGYKFGIFLLLIVFVLGGWFLYDGFLTFQKQEVTFKNNDITLAGSLYLPTGDCPCPAVLFIHGSGSQTRGEYRYYAYKLAQNGIISLVYDKRGTGGSTGELYDSDYEDYAKDALAGMKFLRQRKDVKEDGVGFIGYSEGEWVAPLAFGFATEKPNFIAVVGASGFSPAGQVNEEVKIRLSSSGFDSSAISQAISLNKWVFHFQRTGENRDSLLTAIQRNRNESWFITAEDIPKSDDELGQFEDYSWWRSVMDTNPDSLWSQVDVPILFLKGEQDDRSRADLAERKLMTALKQTNNNIEFIHFSGADHMILEWPLGKNVPPPVFSEGYLDKIVEWIFENQ